MPICDYEGCTMRYIIIQMQHFVVLDSVQSVVDNSFYYNSGMYTDVLSNQNQLWSWG